MLSGLIADVFKKVLKDKEVQEFLMTFADKLVGGVIENRLKPLLSFLLGSAVKQFSEAIPGGAAIKNAIDMAGNIQNDLDRLAESLPNTGNVQIDQFIDDFWGKR
jgi:hypothetical protein